MSGPFKMKGFSGFGNSPMKQDLIKKPVGPVEDIDVQLEEGVVEPEEHLETKHKEYLERKKEKSTEKTKKKVDIAYGTLKN